MASGNVDWILDLLRLCPRAASQCRPDELDAIGPEIAVEVRRHRRQLLQRVDPGRPRIARAIRAEENHLAAVGAHPLDEQVGPAPEEPGDVDWDHDPGVAAGLGDIAGPAESE